jgi:hypothetical protein
MAGEPDGAQALSLMLWSTLFMIDVPLMAAASFITRIAAFNACPSGIPSGWEKRASSLLSEASATVTITPSPNDQWSLQGRGHPSRGPWRSFEAVEFATLEWVDWFNNRRLLEPIGNIPPAEAEERTAPCRTKLTWPHNLNEMASGKPSAVQFSWNSPFGRRVCHCHGFPSN